MDFIINYWWIIVIIIAAVTVAAVAIIKFIRTPTNEQLIMVKSWLLQAVALAEKEFGGKTGAIKLSYVYELFIARFPKLALVITFDMFSAMVDEVLEKFRNMLDSNESLKEYISK